MFKIKTMKFDGTFEAEYDYKSFTFSGGEIHPRYIKLPDDYRVIKTII